MKTFLFVLALLAMASAAFAVAQTETATIDVYQGHTFFGLPIVPLDPNPETLLTGLDVVNVGILMRLDATTQGYPQYYWDQTFNLLLGEGYWIDYTGGSISPSPKSITYTGIKEGVPDALGTMTDTWISLPGNQGDGVSAGGWHMISCPYKHNVPFNKVAFSEAGDNILFTDGNTVRTFKDAAEVAPQWVLEPFMGHDNASGGYPQAGYYGFYDQDYMTAGGVYFVQTLVDNLAMIIPHP